MSSLVLSQFYQPIKSKNNYDTIIYNPNPIPKNIQAKINNFFKDLDSIHKNCKNKAMTMITGIRLPNTKTTPIWRTILKALQKESVDQGSWPLHRTQSKGKHIYTISKMVVGWDK
jgi:hypothetical protein